MNLKAGIFREFMQPKIATDLYRRNLQRAYLDTLITKLGPPPPPPTLPEGIPADVARRVRASFAPLSGEAEAQIRGSFSEIQALLVAGKGKSDRATQLHIVAALKAIAEALDPKK